MHIGPLEDPQSQKKKNITDARSWPQLGARALIGSLDHVVLFTAVK